MGNLTERVNEFYGLYSKKQMMKALFRKHRDIVDRVDFRGFLPRVYLIGEDHTQEPHIRFAIEAVQTLRPEVLLYESISERINPDKVKGITFEEILEEHGLERYRGKILDIIPEIEVEKFSILKSNNIGDENRDFYIEMFGEREAENLIKIKEYQEDPTKLLAEPTYFLSHDAYMLFIEAYRKLIQGENKDLILEIKKILGRKPVRGDENLALFELMGFLDFPSTNCDFKKINGALHDSRLSNSFTEKIKSMVNLYLRLKNDEAVDYNILMIDTPEIAGHTKYAKHLRVVCSNTGIPIHPFDDQEAKEQLLTNLKQKNEIDALSKDERTKYNELMGDINAKREKEMERILMEFAFNGNDIIFTYGGRDHISSRFGFEAQIVDMLNRNKIPYCRIVLKSNGEKPIFMRNIEYILYLEEQKRISEMLKGGKDGYNL